MECIEMKENQEAWNESNGIKWNKTEWSDMKIVMKSNGVTWTGGNIWWKEISWKEIYGIK